MKKTILAFGLFITTSVLASDFDFSRYERMIDFSVSGITTPKVVILETEEDLSGKTVLIDNATGEAIVHQIRRQTAAENQLLQPKVIDSSPLAQGSLNALLDRNSNTTLTFDSTKNEHFLLFEFPQPVSLSQVYIDLDREVIYPKRMALDADFGDGQMQRFIDWKDFSNRFSFPEVSVKQLKLKLISPHFLRLVDIHFRNKTIISTEVNQLIFFAREGGDYRLYFQDHFGSKTYTPKKRQPLSVDSKTTRLSLQDSVQNPGFDNDFDKDGLDDRIDLCPKVADSENTDLDKNGRGDFCEDPDQDRVLSYEDNCPFFYNPDQADKDLDQIGDACDDANDQATESMPYLLWIVFILGALILGFLVWRSFEKK
jgi:hypothetical protein